jgi:hypothetical protein
MLHRRRHWLLRLASVGLPLLLLVGCGSRDGTDSGSSSTTGQLRIVNALASGTPVDVYVDSSRVATGITAGTASPTLALDSGTHTVSVATGSGIERNPVSLSVASGSATTLVAWNSATDTVSYQALDDNQTAPASGRTRLQLFDAARAAGTLDIHLSDTSATLGEATRLVGSLTAGSTLATLQVDAGARRLRVLGTGSVQERDVRLDIPLTLPDRGTATLVITPSVGGVLTHALLVPAGAAVTALNNTRARMRLVTGVSTSTTVTGRFGGTDVGSFTGSPSVGTYVLIPAGTGTLAVTVGDTPVTGPTWTADPGSDTTVLVMNGATSPQVTALADDNRPPTGSGQVRLRLVHGLGDLNQPLALALNYGAPLGTAMQGAASDYALVTATTDATVSVSRTVGGTATVWDTTRTLDSQGVYTLFLLGDSQKAVGDGRLSTLLKE